MRLFRRNRREWLIIHEHYCTKKKPRERFVNRKKRIFRNNATKVEVLTAPRLMSLRGNYEEVATFFNKLRAKATGKKQIPKLRVDFEHISKLKPGAALILASELYRWQTLNSIKLSPYKLSRWDEDVKRLFFEMGLFDLLKTPVNYNADNFKSKGPQTFFKFLTGKTSDGELANTLMEAMSPIINTHYNESLLYVALSEAMTNVLNHAYPVDSDVYKSDIRNRWWLSGSFNSESRIMTVLMYDHGVGIPTTLPSHKDFYKDIIQYLADRKHAITNPGRLIQAAVKVGRSRTHEGHRGKGLRQILRFSSDSKFGRLYIVSRKGEYFFSEDCAEETNACPVELGGTFIQWEIRLKQGEHYENDSFKDCRGFH